MNYIEVALLLLILVCGIASCVSKNMMVTVIIFMAYSVMMSIVWAIMKAPDLSITEAAVGAGISSILLFLTLRKIRSLNHEWELEKQENEKNKTEGKKK